MGRGALDIVDTIVMASCGLLTVGVVGWSLARTFPGDDGQGP